MKPIVSYHAHCPDGFGAAYVAWKSLGYDAEYLPRNYNDEPLPIETFADREVYLLDFSFDNETLIDILRVARKVVWLDHHKTCVVPAAEATRLFACLDERQCGALIAWDFFNGTVRYPVLLEHIDDYDRWQFKLNGTKEINKALWAHAPWSFAQWDRFDTTTLYQEGVLLLADHHAKVKTCVEANAMDCVIPFRGIEGLKGRAANCPTHLTSDVGHELAVQATTYGLCWTLNSQGQVLASLRSNGDFDVSQIAHEYGGGGHKNAAGFTTTLTELTSWLKIGTSR